jgi:biotin carboxyl carrier protein
MPTSQIFRAQVGERFYDIRLQEGTLLLNEAPVTANLAPVHAGAWSLLLDGRHVPLVVEPLPEGLLRITIGAQQRVVRVQNETDLLREKFGFGHRSSDAARQVKAPMPGLVRKVEVQPGQAVKAGDSLLVLEAMKMENELRATIDAVVKHVHVSSGDAVGKNALLLEFE